MSKTDHLTLKNREMLNMPSVPAEQDENLSAEIKRMFGIMYSGGYTEGIGLAANQIGLNKRVIVIDVNGLKQEFINPVITKTLGRKIISTEGCLSFPGKKVRVWRYPQIVVEGFDANWAPIKRKLKGLAACVVQHEIDHLDGITIND